MLAFGGCPAGMSHTSAPLRRARASTRAQNVTTQPSPAQRAQSPVTTLHMHAAEYCSELSPESRERVRLQLVAPAEPLSSLARCIPNSSSSTHPTHIIVTEPPTPSALQSYCPRSRLDFGSSSSPLSLSQPASTHPHPHHTHTHHSSHTSTPRQRHTLPFSIDPAARPPAA